MIDLIKTTIIEGVQDLVTGSNSSERKKNFVIYTKILQQT